MQAALALAVAAGALPAQSRALRESDAAQTTLVLRPAFSLDVFSIGNGQRKGGVTFGGEVEWLPRRPAMVNLAVYRALDPGGATLHSLVEIGGAMRVRERLAVADKEIFMHGEVRGDSTYSWYLDGQTVARKFLTFRGGLIMSRVYQPGTTPAVSSTARIGYAGIARNELVNDARGAFGLRCIKSLGADLLVGSAGSAAIPRGGTLGMRGFIRTDFGTGSSITSRIEAGSRPGEGFYAALTLDLNIMFTRVMAL
jgi:hypothetical protein